MKKNFKSAPTLLCFIFVFGSCQNIQNNNDKNFEGKLSSDNGQLDLSRSTLEQQKIEKIRAKELLLEAREKRVVILSNNKEILSQTSAINIAVYARETFNPIGKRLYKRLIVKSKKMNPCLRFQSADDAQRFFLLKNGPEKDSWSLDQDGDGFACSWSPDKYRKIVVK